MKSSVSRQAHHRQFEVAATEDFAFVRSVVRGIRCLANLGHHKSGSKGSGPRPRRYLVVMNPFSGTGQGQRIYDSTVKPMFAQAGIDHDLCVTQHGGHAMDRMASSLGDSRHDSEAECDEQAESRDLSSYDALIAMGGDGMLWELQQGILARHDSEIILKKLSFGIIGCGTCNGLAATLLHWANEKYSPLESTYMICKGQIGPMDLSRYETLSGKIYIVGIHMARDAVNGRGVPKSAQRPRGCDFIDADRMSIAGKGVDWKGASNIRTNAKFQDTDFV